MVISSSQITTFERTEDTGEVFYNSGAKVHAAFLQRLWKYIEMK